MKTRATWAVSALALAGSGLCIAWACLRDGREINGNDGTDHVAAAREIVWVFAMAGIGVLGIFRW